MVKGVQMGSTIFGIALLISSASLHSRSAIQSEHANDPTAIRTLISEFVEALRRGESIERFLSPSIRPEDREAELNRAKKQFTSFNISGYDTGSVQSSTKGQIGIRAIVSWTAPGESVEIETESRLEHTRGEWFFADVQFLSFPWKGLLPAFAVFTLATIGIAVSWLHLRRHEFPDAQIQERWNYLVMLPLFGAVAYFLIRPWKRT